MLGGRESRRVAMKVAQDGQSWVGLVDRNSVPTGTTEGLFGVTSKRSLPTREQRLPSAVPSGLCLFLQPYPRTSYGATFSRPGNAGTHNNAVIGTIWTALVLTYRVPVSNMV